MTVREVSYRNSGKVARRVVLRRFCCWISRSKGKPAGYARCSSKGPSCTNAFQALVSTLDSASVMMFPVAATKPKPATICIILK